VTVEVKINDNGIFKKMTEVFPYVADEAIPMANELMIGIMKEYPPYSYVSMQQAGGWRSEKQRRFVMASIRSGAIRIPYTRTYQLKVGWMAEGDGRNQKIVNNTPYAQHVQGRDQAQMMGLRNWTSVKDLPWELAKTAIMNAVREGVQIGLQKLGLK
jgi:hypothetical protein